MVSPLGNPTASPPKKQAVVGSSLGLVIRPITDRTIYAPINHGHLNVYADLTELTVTTYESPNKKDRPVSHRGDVTEFSHKSRVRMLRQIAKIRDMSNGMFCTLTYPGKWQFDRSAPKAHLSALRKRIARLFPEAGVVWRLELKTRQTGYSAGLIVPHFHLLVFHPGVPMYQFRDWLAWAWNMIVDPKDFTHRLAGTQCDPITNRHHAMAYATKYSAKVKDDEDGGNWGRRWGMFGELDRAAILSIPISRPEFIDIRRMFVGLLKSRLNQRLMKMKADRKEPEKIAAVRKKKYYKKLRRGGTKKGFAVLGVGDLSCEKCPYLEASTAYKIVRVSCGVY